MPWSFCKITGRVDWTTRARCRSKTNLVNTNSVSSFHWTGPNQLAVAFLDCGDRSRIRNTPPLLRCQLTSDVRTRANVFHFSSTSCLITPLSINWRCSSVSASEMSVRADSQSTIKSHHHHHHHQQQQQHQFTCLRKQSAEVTTARDNKTRETAPREF